MAALRIVTKLSTVEHLRDPPDGSPGLAAVFAVAVSRCAAEGANSSFVRHYSSVCLERLCAGAGGLRLVSNNHHNPNDAREALAIIASLQECEEDTFGTTANTARRALSYMFEGDCQPNTSSTHLDPLIATHHYPPVPTSTHHYLPITINDLQ